MIASNALLATDVAALIRLPTALDIPLAIPEMIFIPTLPQFTLVNAFLIWLIMDGILPSNAGMP